MDWEFVTSAKFRIILNIKSEIFSLKRVLNHKNTQCSSWTYIVVVEVSGGQSSSVERNDAWRRVDGKGSVSGNWSSVDEKVVGNSGDVWPDDVSTNDRRYVDVRLEL